MKLSATGLITSILALTFSGLQAQAQPPVPRLVVTLTIDQLRTDYMEAFSSLYGEGGFKRLMREGKVFRQAEMPFTRPDRASAIASIHTGSTPSANGIIARRWMDSQTLRPVNCVDDPAFMGNYTDENTSPAKLLTSTLADELRIATRNGGMIYAIAPFRDAAVLSAGHAGNGAFWLNAETGKWCSTTYYSDFPWWLSNYNEQRSPDFRIKDMAWEPVYPMNRYVFLPDWRTMPFKYNLDTEGDNKFRRLLTTPLINDEVNLLVEELLDKDANYIYVDVGGGSTEISLINEGKLKNSRSYNIGTVRLLKGSVTQYTRSRLRRDLSQFAQLYPGLRIIGSGGNINKLFRIAMTPAKNNIEFPVEKLQAVNEQLKALSTEERMAKYKLRPDRADVITHAADIFLEIAGHTGAQTILVPTIGLSDGIIDSLYVKGRGD